MSAVIHIYDRHAGIIRDAQAPDPDFEHACAPCPPAKAEEYALVLVSAGIDVHIVPTRVGMALLVRTPVAARPRQELAAHARENAPRPRLFHPGPAAANTFDAPLLFCLTLFVLFLADQGSAFDIDWVGAGSARGELILGGELWRTVTALSLHVDFGHLFGNLVLGVVCGLLLMEVLGAGVAWSSILAAGALGNLLNALVQGPDHASIGASTAVFGAVGVLSGHAQKDRSRPQRGGIGRWAPLAAGVMLLAFLGFGGGRTDVGAHIAGFAVGAAIGFALARLPREWLQSGPLQLRCGLAALGVLVLSWLIALAAADA